MGKRVNCLRRRVTPPNPNVISWDEYFMGIALLSCYRSKDPRSRMGVCIVNENNRIVGIGYNGFPSGVEDMPWDREGEWLDTKYPYVCHAELNAVLNSFGDLRGCRMYTRVFPCNECAKIIIQAGIKEVIYLHHNVSKDTPYFEAARRLFNAADVTYCQLCDVNLKKVTLDPEVTNP